MKTIFSMLLIIFFVTAGFSQTNISSDNKFNSTVSADDQEIVVSKIYPNPVRDVVNIDLQALQGGFLQVKIYNILGDVVRFWDSLEVIQGSQQLTLDLSNFKTGVYIVRFTKGNTVVSQVIKKS
jgi:hypothetical protein